MAVYARGGVLDLDFFWPFDDDFGPLPDHLRQQFWYHWKALDWRYISALKYVPIAMNRYLNGSIENLVGKISVFGQPFEALQLMLGP